MTHMMPQEAVAEFTRPADTTAYADGDLVANSTTAASVTPMELGGWGMVIRRALLTKSDDDTTNATFRLHLFASDPTTSALTNGDNGALSLNTAIKDYLGSFVFDMTSSPDIYNTAGNLAVGVPVKGSEIVVASSINPVYGLLEATGAYTPASGETFTVKIEFLRG